MNKNEMIKIASNLLHKDMKTIEQCSGMIEEVNALYVSIPQKGGASIIVDNDGSVLYADSSIDFDIHLAEFKKGRRTSKSRFH